MLQRVIALLAVSAHTPCVKETRFPKQKKVRLTPSTPLAAVGEDRQHSITYGERVARWYSVFQYTTYSYTVAPVSKHGNTIVTHPKRMRTRPTYTAHSLVFSRDVISNKLSILSLDSCSFYTSFLSSTGRCLHDHYCLCVTSVSCRGRICWLRTTPTDSSEQRQHSHSTIQHHRRLTDALSLFILL